MSKINIDIKINKEDIVPYIYFVCSIAQRGKMYGGLSSKSDLMGGIFDRWVNIIPEGIIFNKYFLPKISNDLKVITDYYEYNPKFSGIAPDVLGIKLGSAPKPFVEYSEKWLPIEGAPQIEVKSFKKEQYMVSLRNQGYSNKYLVMVETQINSDYLIPFFEKYIFSEDVFNELKMDDTVFVKANKNKGLSSVPRINLNDLNIGLLKLITVCFASNFMNYANFCKASESPLYIKEIIETRFIERFEFVPFKDFLTRNIYGMYKWNYNILYTNDKHKLLDVFMENIENIYYVKNSKSTITVMAKGFASINNFPLKKGKMYIIKFQILDRSSNKGEEYFMHKSVIDRIPNAEESMLKHIKDYIK